MDQSALAATVQAMMHPGKGLLAMDESNPTCNKRFAKLGIPQTVEARRAWRELILTTPGLGEYISGTILFDETLRRSKNDGAPFLRLVTAAGMIPGIKVDAGAKIWPVIPARRSAKVSMACDSAWPNIGRWAHVLPSGGRSLRLARVFPAAAVWKQTPTS